jgi:protein-tyrosine phosphatase
VWYDSIIKKLEEFVSTVKRICFVCLGNIIRSPLAQHLFEQQAKEAGVDHKYQTSSAGLGSWHVGEQPDSRMKRVASRHGIQMVTRARQFSPSEFDDFDLILVMDAENLQRIKTLARRDSDLKKIHMLREFDPEGSDSSPVPDPYYGGPNGFEEVFQIVNRSVSGLLEKLESGELERK